MKKAIVIFTVFHAFLSNAQETKRVLFLGNSYTAVNNLPQLVANFAQADGNTLVFDSNTPGGHTLQGHSSNATSLSKIAQGNWDYVVLQEQSQLPSFPMNQVQTSVFPYAKILDSLNLVSNPCGETMFYMTWGRKNGDASNCANWPPVCTYAGMDSLLALRYMMMANDNKAEISPVGAVWKYLRANHPGIELYQADESHPSEAGSYAAACAFYTSIFKKNPVGINYNFTLSAADVQAIQNAVKIIVFDQLNQWNSGISNPAADFSFQATSLFTYQFNALVQNANQLLWDFGDGNTDTLANPIHTYTAIGTYTVKLTASKCGKTAMAEKPVNIQQVSIQNENLLPNLHLFPNPTNDALILEGADFNSQVQILDMNGKVVFSHRIISQTALLQIGELPAGVYCLIGTSKGSLTRKIFVKH